jgi:hypothetical protein
MHPATAAGLAVTCGYISSNDNFRSVQHLHEEAACDKESDVAVPGGDHLSGNSACPPVVSRFDGIHPEQLRVLSGRLIPAGAGT